MVFRNKILGISALTALGLVGATAPALAQDTTEEEIVVTATRRAANVQDVPATVAVLGGEQLERTGAEQFEDYLGSVPAVGFTDVGGGGSPRIGIRGVANVTGSEYGVTDSVETVGLYLNEVAVSGSGSLPDLAIFDLNRVEVLKGPQGTLFGEGAMSGAVRLIANSPDYDQVEGRAEYTFGSIADGGAQQRVRGVLNLPLIQDRVALRLVGSAGYSDGFIDNVAQGVEDINSSERRSLRATLGARLTDSIDLEFTYMNDHNQVDDFNDVNPTLGERQQSFLEDRGSEQDFNLYSLTATIDFGFADLTSVSSFVDVSREMRPRFSLFGFSDETLPVEISQEAFTQELRLVSSSDGPLQWVLGGFYRDREQQVCGEYDAPGGAGAFGSSAVGIDRPCAISRADFVLYRNAVEEFTQTAFYGEATFDITPRLHVTAGARWFEEDLSLSQDLTATGALAFLSNASAVDASSSDTIFKAGVSYDITDDLLIYATFSQGFRSGGPNLNSALVPGVIPPLYEPDTLDNYEIGFKSQTDDGRYTFNAAVFLTEWNDIQIGDAVIVLGNPFGFQSNQGAAEVRGVEVAFNGRPTDALSFGLSVAYLDSELTEASAGSALLVGQDLTNTPEYTASLFGEYRFPAIAGSEGFLRADYSYAAEQSPDLLIGPGLGVQIGPAYRPLDERNMLNFRAGLEFDHFAMEAFVTNALDEDIEYGIDDPSAGSSVLIGEPRVMGVTLRYTY